jgi:hypothetical protein
VWWGAAVLRVPFIALDGEGKDRERGGHRRQCTFNADHF